eukprot:gene11633-13583_t
MKECDAIVKKCAGFSAIDMIYDNPTDLTFHEEKRIAVVSLVQCCIAAVYESYGVSPHFVLSYCGGQNAADVMSGLVSLEDMLIFSTGYLARLKEKLQHTGGMGVVHLGSGDLSILIEDLGLEENVFIVESSTSIHCLVSGDNYGFQKLLKELRDRNIKYVYNRQNIPWHCRLVESVKEVPCYDQTIMPPKVPIYVAGRIIDQSSYKDFKTYPYWSTLLRNPVRFDQDVRTILEKEPDCDAFIEISTAPIIGGILRRNLLEKGKPKNLVAQSMLHGQENNFDTLMATLAKLNVGGYPVKWEVAYPHHNHIIVQEYVRSITKPSNL